MLTLKDKNKNKETALMMNITNILRQMRVLHAQSGVMRGLHGLVWKVLVIRKLILVSLVILIII